MRVGARNQLKGTVTAITRGDVMAQIKFAIPAESTMGSVITVESLDEMELKIGDEVLLFVKAIHVLPVKEA
ncbi:MAG: TOBE domain-containing protein [Candidatus Eisenbacteria bacterium]|jgi:molybdate transport system regulatory protein|nr:TOBE domain-containing protein [Candidatus Eisenbacteria bacterium]